MEIEKNREYEIEITAYSSEGAGIGRIDGYTVFVPFAAVGDVAVVRLVKKGKSFGYGKLMRLISPSPNRREPLCGQFTKCGGCSIMHLSRQEQLSFKRQKVRDALCRIAGADIQVEPTVGLSEHYYRNKAQLPVTEGPMAGFFAPRSHRVVSAEGCMIQHRDNPEIVNCVLEYMKDYNIAPYDPETHRGIVRHIYTRFAVGTGEVMVSIVGNSEKPPKGDLPERLLAVNPNITSVVYNVNTKRTNTILGDRDIVLYGKDYIIDKLCNLSFKVSHRSFYQVNPEMTEKLYEQAVSLAAAGENDTVFDLYCGAGTISLTLAKTAGRVIGVEVVPQAIENAKDNAALNGIENARFYVGEAEKVVPKLYNEGICADVVVVDPPRKGCDGALLETIVKMAPKRVVYVSCDPATMARDVKYLSQNGFELISVTPFDQFPQTHHVESVALLTLSTTKFAEGGK